MPALLRSTGSAANDNETLLATSTSGGGTVRRFRIWQASYNFTTRQYVPLSPIPAVSRRRILWIEMRGDVPTTRRQMTMAWTVGGTTQQWNTSLFGDLSRTKHMLLFYNSTWKDKALTLATDISYTETLSGGGTGVRNKNALIKIGYWQ